MKYVLLLIGVIELLELHGPDGQIAYINPHEISSLRAPTSKDIANHFPKGVHCVVVTTNGKFLATVETCQEIRNMLLHK